MESVFLAGACGGRVSIPCFQVEGDESGESVIVVNGVGGLRVSRERDVGETRGVAIAQGMGNHHLSVVGRPGVWLCTIDGDGLPGYIAVAGALMEVDAFDVLFLLVLVRKRRR